jgi:hypothetical protein
MSEIHTEVEIDATAEQVWQVLTNFPAYLEWNSKIWPNAGELRAGARLRVRVRVAGGLSFAFRATVLKAEPGRELCWVGRLPARLLEGRHSFSIVPLEQKRVRFVHREVYSGLLVPIYMLVMGSWLRRTYKGMNRELKLRAERQPA